MKRLAAFVAASACAFAQTTPDEAPSTNLIPTSHWYDHLALPYVPRMVAPVRFENSSRVENLLRAGSLYLSLPDAIALALENNLDIEFDRYHETIASTDVLKRAQRLRDAIGADPAFGLAYVSLVETAALIPGENVEQFVGEAAGHRNSFTPIDQARWNAVTARFSHAPLARQASTTAAILQLAPNDVDALTALASDSYLEGDASEGDRLMRRALDLSHDNPAIRAQMAQGMLRTRNFRGAEQIFAGLESNPAVLPELAICILLEGDAARANAVFTRYLELRQSAGDPAVPFSHASWIAITAGTEQAIAYLRSLKLPTPDRQSLALSQIAVWHLVSRDRADAEHSASLAARIAASPLAKAFASAALLIAAGDDSAEDLRSRLASFAADEGTKQAVLAYGLFLYGRYSEAAGVWEAAYRESGGTDLRSRTMLAACLQRSGRAPEANALRVEPFVLNFSGTDEYAAIAFGEMRRLLNLGGR